MQISCDILRTARAYIVCIALFVISEKCVSQTVSCEDTLRSATISSPSLDPSEKYFSTSSFDNGTLIFQNLSGTPKGIVLIKANHHSMPAWSRKIIQNTRTDWNKISELDDHNILLSSDYYATGTSGLAINQMLLDSAGGFLWCGSYNNQLMDSGMKVINSGDPGNIITAGLRTSPNGNGLVVESFNYVNDEENWNRNYLASELNNFSLTVCRIWKNNNNIFITGTFAGRFTMEAGIWLLKCDYPTGRLISYKAYALHNSKPAADSIVPSGLKQMQNLATGESAFLFRVGNGSDSENSFVYMRCDSNLNIISTPTIIITPFQTNDIATAALNKSGSAVIVILHAGSYGASVCFLDSTSRTIQKYFQYTLSADLANTQLNLDFTSRLKSFIPVVQAGTLSFQVFESAPYINSADISCLSVQDSDFVLRGALTVSPALIRWTSSGFDIATITSVTIRSVSDIISNGSVVCELKTRCDSLSVRGPASICLNDSAYTFTASRNSECLNHLVWTTDDQVAKIFFAAGDSTMRLKAISPGLTFVKVSVAGCTLTDSIAVHINSLPKVSLGNDTVLCEKSMLTLRATGFEHYLWQDGSTDSVYGVKNAGHFSITVTDGCGLQGGDSVSVIYKNCTTGFKMPNAFTPNEDGVNDEIKPHVVGTLVLYDFRIYNRWGQMVFHSGNPGQGWNGEISGGKQGTGSYVWLCRYQFAGEKIIEDKGTFVLIR